MEGNMTRASLSGSITFAFELWLSFSCRIVKRALEIKGRISWFREYFITKWDKRMLDVKTSEIN